jgi:hypothetical protein
VALAIAVGLAIGAASPASAQSASAQPASAQPASTQPVTEPLATQQLKTPEILTQKPSGFWTSNRPAVGGAYRWRLLGIGVVLLAITGYGMLWLIRRAKAERAGADRTGRR